MDSKTRWIKTGRIHDFVFVAKEVIATTSGYHVIFYNLVTNEERIEYFNDSLRGEGACCLAGHPIIPVFATSERCYKPKIYIHTYPDIKKVAVCKLNKTLNSYLSCCFAGTEFILSLTSFPDFQMIVWRWRTGEKLSSMSTRGTDEHQILKSPTTLHNLVFHFSITSGKLSTYEIHSYSKGVFITEHDVTEVKTKIACASWTSTTHLLLCDVLQNAYIASSDGKKVQIILNGDSSVPVDRELSILPIQSGFLLVDGHSRLRCFKKIVRETHPNESWDVSWSVDFASHPVKITLAQHEEAILLQDTSGKIFKLLLFQNEKPKPEQIMVDSRGITAICTLEPLETHIILLKNTNDLMVFDILEGEITTSLCISCDDSVICMVTHPQLPVIALCTSTGKIIFLTATESKIEIVKILYVQKEPLGFVRFSDTGQNLGIISNNPTQLFLAKTMLKEGLDIFFHTEFNKLVADILIFEKADCARVLLLIASLSSAKGNCIEMYSIRHGQKCLNAYHRIYLSQYYGTLFYTPGRADEFSSSPYLSKQIHFFRVEIEEDLIVMTGAISSHHDLRKCQISASKDFMVTSSLDGRLIVRNNSEVTKIVDTFSVHHYQEGGTAFSMFLSRSGIIVSLGKNGSLVGIQYSSGDDRDQIEIQKKLKDFHKSKWKPVKEDNAVPTWIELKKMKLIEREMEESSKLKKSVLDELNDLKMQIRESINLNTAKRIECQVPLSSFDLDKMKRAKTIEAATEIRKKTEISLEKNIVEFERIISHLMEKYWNEIEVHGVRLWSFDCTLGVDNFPLQSLGKEYTMQDFYIEFFDTPLLLPYANECHEEMPIKIIEEVSRLQNFRKFAKDSLSNPNPKQTIGTNSISTTSEKWIQDGEDDDRNQQAKESSQHLEYDFGTSKEYKLKKYFNEEFDSIRLFKCKILEKSIERLQMIKKYQNELTTFFGISTVTSELIRILWHSEKIPERMVMIMEEDILTNDECDSRQEFRDDGVVVFETVNTFYTEELRRFRRVKLEEMMDGLLEVRWEDEIKRDVPKPKCLLLKKPSDYTEKDIQAVNLYNNKVEKLKHEREKYKNHLKSEISSLESSINNDLEDFNQKMQELSLKKIIMKAAVLQEFFLFMNKRRENTLYTRGVELISVIMAKDLEVLELKSQELMNKIATIESIVVELKSKFESLLKRDKSHESKFRNEFVDLKQPMVEHLLRQYKRRPRIGQITCTSLTCLIETVKCLTSSKKSAILPREYLDFLRGMDALDVMPNNLPPQIEISHWQSLCKLRRNRVEIEIKMRAAALELNETEQTLVHLQKLSSSTQSQVFSLRNTSEEEKIKLTTLLENPNVQLVLKTAQVEIPILGNVTDYDNVVVVPCQRLLDLNNEILREGERKIRIMRSFVSLKNAILTRDWKNRCLSKNLENLQEHLALLETLRVKREVRSYLLERLEKRIRYTDASSCDRMLKSVRKKFQCMLKTEKLNLLKIIREIKYWTNKNVELLTSVQELSLKKQLDCSILEEDPLHRKNRMFHANCFDSIMERNTLIEDIQRNRDELLHLKAELELLKLKTFPTLRFKDKTRNNDLASFGAKKEKMKQ
ncbi:hypothetical protein QAD02_017692 [Eretmocerus hayati]|uniref:Uncharacterized protein n=1 Tax=Eretmocerus hayati TaxID=131215 RepID=A0ACC2PJE3_9HYME|nr:hypothetical protein QAD02_017692 [Eretmocerus hayati]